jgi:hypothetical protein
MLSDAPLAPAFTNAAPLPAAPSTASRLSPEVMMIAGRRMATARITGTIEPTSSSRPSAVCTPSPAGPFASARPIAANSPPPSSRAGTVTYRFTHMPSPYWTSRATAVPRLARRITSSGLNRVPEGGRDVTDTPDIAAVTSTGLACHTIGYLGSQYSF